MAQTMLFIELGIALLFLFSCYAAWKIGKLDLVIYAAVFALFFENLNIILFYGQPGGYFYGRSFLFSVLHTPLFIPLSWGILLLSSYALASAITTNRLGKIFLVPLLTVMVDFAMDPIAVKLGYWTWIGVGSQTGIFSVSPSNYIGWIAVSFGFMVFYELVPWRWLSMFAGYSIFIVMSGICYLAQQLFGIDGPKGYATVSFLLVIFIGLFFISGYGTRHASKKKIMEPGLVQSILPRYGFYLFSLLYMFHVGMHTDKLFLIVVAAVSFIEMWMFSRIVLHRIVV